MKIDLMSGDLHSVRVEDIDIDPGPYCMSYGFDLEPLLRSVGEIGVVNPPLLEASEIGGRMKVIAGYRRILALKASGNRRFLTRVLKGSSEPSLALFLLNLHDNLSTRALNPVEKGMVLNRLGRFLSDEEILTRYLPLLGLPPRRDTLPFYRRLETELDEGSKEGLATGEISLQAVKMVLDLDAESRKTVFRAMREMGFNANQQRQFTELLSDLSQASGRSVSQLLKQGLWEDALPDGRVNRPQKAKAVLQRLREKRFPRLSEAEKKFKSLISRMALPQGVKIEPSPYFENPFYRLEVLFKEGKDLEEKIRLLLRKEDLPALRNPWERIE